LEELLDFLRIPSISTLTEHAQDLKSAADWVATRIRGADIQNVEVFSVDGGHPLVYAERLDNPGAPTVLMYGHYDVQPVDPVEEWDTPPFEPTLREGRIYARGSSDDKGQLATHLFALRDLSRVWGPRWPVNVKLIIEGEEESGGASIEKWALQNADRLAADCALISDTAFLKPGLPSMDYGLRGIAYAELEVQGPGRDLHSGLYGGGVLNPLSALARIIDRLLDLESGRILVPGFYDGVIPVSGLDRDQAARVPFDSGRFLEQSGSPALWGEQGYSVYERITARPSLDVNGLWGGFQGQGAKTVIPSRAGAKVSMRLVPDQDPDDLLRKLEDYVTDLAPEGVTVACRTIHKARGVLMDPSNPFMEAAAGALEEVFGKAPVFTRCGASIPISTIFHVNLGMPVLFMGFGLPDDGLHSPNEKMDISQFYGGIEAVKKLLGRLARFTAGRPIK